jgi:predicted transcriptional regulator
MNIQFTPDLERQLEHIAAEMNRTPSDLVQETMDDYVKHIASLTAEVREGEESAEREGWLTHDEVFERLNKRLLKTA